MNFLRLSELDLAGKRVFIRADFNVPFNPDGTLADDTRIRATLPAICHCLEAGAAVMVTSHLGRPNEGALTAADSLAPVAAALSALLGHPVALIRDWTGGNFRVQPGEVVLLENCRGNFGEKADDPALAARIARFIDVYVNDAFGTAHRKECTLHALASNEVLVGATTVEALVTGQVFAPTKSKFELPLGLNVYGLGCAYGTKQHGSRKQKSRNAFHTFLL